MAKKKSEAPVEAEVEVTVVATVEPKALSVADACKKLGISEVTLRYIADRGDLLVERDEDGVVVGVIL